MEFSRDLSILVIEQYLKDLLTKKPSGTKIKLLDGLAGTGIRGVRIANEIPLAKSPEVTITVNDLNPLAFKILLKNIELNRLTNIIPSNKDLNALLVKNRFNYIDIDPFGSPIKFLDAGCRMLRNNGILAVTATDTAPLFGRYPKTCLRRYDAWSGRTVFSHELGLRILLGCCVRTAARYDLCLKPLLVHATDYYYRLYLHGIHSRSATNNNLENIGYVLAHNRSSEYDIINRNDLYTDFQADSNINNNYISTKKSNLIGPLWTGRLYQPEFIDNLSIGSHKLGTEKQLVKMLSLWREEANAPLGFYDANALASELKITTPPLTKILSALSKTGHFVSRTHFNPNAFKTEASFKEISQVMRNI